jgi:hypothetical protein
MMPHTIHDGQPFPLPCPQCNKNAGIPFLASTALEDRKISVGMRCRACRHEWRCDMPVTDRQRDSGGHLVAKQ